MLANTQLEGLIKEDELIEGLLIRGNTPDHPIKVLKK